MPLWGLGHLIKVYGARLGISQAFFFLLRIGLARIGKMLASSGPLLALSPSRLIECELSSLGPSRREVKGLLEGVKLP